MGSQYLSSSLRITDNYIEKFKNEKIIPEGTSDQTIRDDLEKEFSKYWNAIMFELLKANSFVKDVFEKLTKIKMPDKSIDELFPRDVLFNLLFNLYGDFLKFRISELSEKEWKKEFGNSLRAFSINYRTTHLDVIQKRVLSKRSPEKLLEDFKKDRYEIKVNKALLEKLTKSGNTSYLEFLDASIEFLKPDFFPNTTNPSKQFPLFSVETSNRNLKSQFSNSDRYEEVIGKLIKAGNIKRHADGNLIFVPITRKNAQYEAVTLFEALNELGFLAERCRTYDEIRVILSNTFIDWNLSVRTIGDKKTRIRLADYKAIVS